MDLDRTSLEWTDHDYSSFRYRFRGSCTVVTKIQGKDGVHFEQKTFTNKDEWKTWLNNASFLRPDEGSSNPAICIVLCGRGDTDFDSTWENMQSPIHYLPLDQSTFVQLVQLFRIHPRITRTIGREACYFSVQHHEGTDEEENMITCTARTSSQLSDDLALSSAFIPHLNLSLAVIYGCNPKQKRETIRRIQTCDLSQVHHPLLLAGMFFEMERVRLGNAVDKLLDNFALRGSSSDRDLDLDMDKARMTEFLRSCYESRELVNHIKAVQLQLKKLTDAVANPNSYITSPLSSPSHSFKTNNFASIDSLTPPSTPAKPTHNNTNLKSTNIINPQASAIIQTRLNDITQELTTKIHDSTLVNSNMSLTMTTAMSHFARLDNQTNLKLSRVNTELARTNTGLSQEMQRDSSQMKSIALLTMVFLPISTVASIFSTDFFQWDANTDKGEDVVNGWVWVLVVISGGLTFLVVGIWWWATRIRIRGRRRRGFGLRGKGKGKLNGVVKRRMGVGRWAKGGRVGRAMGRVVRGMRLKGEGRENMSVTDENKAGTGRVEMDVDLERGLDVMEMEGMGNVARLE